MNRLVLDHTYVQGFVQAQELANLAPEVKLAHERLHQGTGAGSDFLGWIDLPMNYDREEFARIKDAAARIRETPRYL